MFERLPRCTHHRQGRRSATSHAGGRAPRRPRATRRPAVLLDQQNGQAENHSGRTLPAIVRSPLAVCTRRFAIRLLGFLLLAAWPLMGATTSLAVEESLPRSANQPAALELPKGLWEDPDALLSPQRLTSTMKIMLLLTVLSLAPTILVMTTSFVRVIVVLGLLRQALGTQQLPPSQVITVLALFLTLLIMTPVWKEVYSDAIEPYTNRQLTLEQAWERGIAPVRRFMSLQVERTGNADDIWLFMDYLPDAPTPTNYDEVPLPALLPAFMLSELKTAFLIGFQIYLPFLILDMVISTVMISMGMLMLPPVLISLPFKLLLFVLVDGWHLVVGKLLESFAPLA